MSDRACCCKSCTECCIDEEDECRCHSSATFTAAAEMNVVDWRSDRCAKMNVQCQMQIQAAHRTTCQSSYPSQPAWSQRLRQASNSGLLRQHRTATRRHPLVTVSCNARSRATVHAVATGSDLPKVEVSEVSECFTLIPYTVATAPDMLCTGVEQLTLQPIKRIEGHVKLPGSKSLSNRILLLAALSEGTTEVQNLLVRIACSCTRAFVHASDVQEMHHTY